jgi:ketosteroid isomerase-like protein
MTTQQIEQENVALIRRGFEAFASGDMEKLREVFHRDAKWRSAPAGVLGGDRYGLDAIFTMFGQLQRETNGTFQCVPNAFAPTGNQVFVRAIVTANRGARSLEDDVVLLYTLEDQRIREIRFYPGDYPANNTFWS